MVCGRQRLQICLVHGLYWQHSRCSGVLDIPDALDVLNVLDVLSKNKDLIIQKSDKGNSVVTVDRQDYIKNE